MSYPLTHSGPTKTTEKGSCNKSSESEQPPPTHPQSTKPKLSSLHPTLRKHGHKNLECSNARNLGNEVPQPKEWEIGGSGVDTAAATQGPAEQ
jgi:hypothetical protein